MEVLESLKLDGVLLVALKFPKAGACIPVGCDLLNVAVCKINLLYIQHSFYLRKWAPFDMGKIQNSSLGRKSYLLCGLASGSWREKLIWDMESWDMQKLRARLCLTFRLNHELDTSNSLCCMLLFAKLAETPSKSEIVPNKIFFPLHIFDPHTYNRKVLLLFQV